MYSHPLSADVELEWANLSVDVMLMPFLQL